VASAVPDAHNEALRYLWARHRIAALADVQAVRQDAQVVAQITQLGLDYNLMTDYTSFIAVDERVRNVDGKLTTVHQPLSLPDGVSDRAVGGEAEAASEMRSARPRRMARARASG